VGPQTVGLAILYAKALIRGDHYQSVITLYDDVSPLIDGDSVSDKRQSLLQCYAVALRMTGQTEKSKSIYEELLTGELSSDDAQHILIGLTLCYESLGKIEDAKDAARRVITIDPIKLVHSLELTLRRTARRHFPGPPIAQTLAPSSS
jgi:hypothetical protein